MILLRGFQESISLQEYVINNNNLLPLFLHELSLRNFGFGPNPWNSSESLFYELLHINELKTNIFLMS